MLANHTIAHRLASRKHLQGDGLVERMVQTLKNGFRKVLLDMSKTEWDLYMPYIAMGYRMSKQAAVGYSPYFLLYWRHPIFQAKIQDFEDAPLPDSDDGKAFGLFLNERGQAFREVMPLAMRNLAIAQNKDREQYRRVRGSGANLIPSHVPCP